MSTAPNLLDDDGTASMATAFMMSHHAFRRDLACFAQTLAKLTPGDEAKSKALREEWVNYRAALHGHHEMEDTRIFPFMKGERPELTETIDRLATDHRKIDPLLERGDRAFAALPDVGEASAVVAELSALLGPHLATEEAEIVPFLRGAKSFPAPANDAEAELYAQGFAWSMYGIAPEVLARIYEMLPSALNDRLPAARAAFEVRWKRAWGAIKVGASRTCVPD